MKRLMLALGVGVFLTLAPLSACSTGSLSANAVSLTSTNAQQSHAMAAASNLYAATARLTATWVRATKPSDEVKKKIGEINDRAKAAIDAGTAADLKGDSPGVAVALALWNRERANLKAYLTGLGVPVPADL